MQLRLKNNEALRENAIHFVLVLVVAVYCLLGAGMFMLLNGPETNETTVLAHNRSQQYISDMKGSFASAVLFAFSTVTTIGYGHDNPNTVGCRIFTIIYALIGIPLTVLTLANIGKFINEGLIRIVTAIVVKIKRARRHRGDRASNMTIQGAQKCNASPQNGDMQVKKNSEAVEQKDFEDGKELGRFIVVTAFLFWTSLGAVLLPIWEPLDHFEAVYFSFISMTTLGYGHYFPQNPKLFPLTLIYVFVGLAVTTMVIEILAEYLQRVHYLGKKIKNVGKTIIWFGGKKASVKDLIHNVLVEIKVDPKVVAYTLENLDTIVQAAVDPEPDPKEKQDAEAEAEELAQSFRSEDKPITEDIFPAIDIRYIDGVEDDGNTLRT